MSGIVGAVRTRSGLIFNTNGKGGSAAEPSPTNKGYNPLAHFDYEAGLWTPAMNAGYPNTNENGYYTRMGHVCFLTSQSYQNGTPTNTTTAVQISGLPFTCGQMGYSHFGVTNTQWYDPDYHGNTGAYVSWMIHPNQVYLWGAVYNGNTSGTQMQSGMLNHGDSAFAMNGWYMVNSW